MNVLFISTKHIGTLDYCLPMLWKLRQTSPDAKISMLNCFANKRQVLRGSTYYDKVCAQLEIEVLDFSDYLTPKWRLFRPLWRWLFQEAAADLTESRGLTGFRMRFQQRNEGNYIERFVEVDKILPSLNPDVVLWSNFNNRVFPKVEAFYEFFEEARIPIVLLPHGVHNIVKTRRVPFGSTNEEKRGDGLPEYSDYWTPTRDETPWVEGVPDKRDQFCWVGYPGLDSDWLDFTQKGSERSATQDEGAPLRTLLICRKFLPKGFERPEGYDPFTLDYDFFFNYLCNLRVAIQKASHPIEIVIKPHPSSSYPMIEEIFAAAEIESWRITHEPFFGLMSSVDMVISLFSTSLLVPAIAGIPTIVYNSPLQEYVHQFGENGEIYEGMEFFAESPDLLEGVLGSAIEAARERRSSEEYTAKDTAHLREFFPDSSSELGIERIHSLLESRNAIPSKA